MTAPFRIKIEAYQEQDLIASLKKSYSDFHLDFDKYMPNLLHKLFELCWKEGISPHLSQNVLKKCLVNKKDFKGFSETIEFIKAILLSALIVLYERSPEAIAKVVDQRFFLAKYPEFSSLSASKINLLLNFRNYLAIALLLIPAYRNKGLLIKLAGRLEGSDCVYVLGKGQTVDVDHRELMYHAEGNIPTPGEETSLSGSESSRKRASDDSFNSPQPQKKKTTKKSSSSSSSDSTSAASASGSELSPVSGSWNAFEEGKVNGPIDTKDAGSWNQTFTAEVDQIFA